MKNNCQSEMKRKLWFMSSSEITEINLTTALLGGVDIFNP